MVSFNEGAHLAWSATFSGGQDVYYSFIPAPVTTDIAGINKTDFSVNIIPNPIKEEATIEIVSTKSNYLNISLVDFNGRIIDVLASQHFNKGVNKIYWRNHGLNAGIYFIYIEDLSGIIYSKKLILLND
jgi:hypothetical protein